MKFLNVKGFVLLLMGIISTDFYAQEAPPVQIYSPLDYGAGNQNWAISQSNSKYIYAANNKGLLEFNGADWKLYNSPNETILRSVKAVGDRIYTGCYMEFGFWEKDEFGSLNYTSLSKDLEKPLVEDEQFWNILNLDNWILFQSLNRIYIYNSIDKSYKVIESEFSVTKSYIVNETLFYQKLNEGIFKLENGREVLVSDNPIFKSNIVVNVYNQNGKLHYVTQKSGIYFFQNNALVKWISPANETIDNLSVYSSIKSKDGNLILGTITNGIYVLNEKGDIIHHIKQNKGLSNNTVLSLIEDVDNNIWLALDNGINCINIKSPYSIYKDLNGNIGTVYTSIVYNNYIYLGTNQGLFYRQIDTEEDFNLIEGTKGQVWSLAEINNTLFCGHDSGTYVIKLDKAEKTSDVQGTWHLVAIPNKPNLLLQGNYQGLHILEKKNSKWSYRNKLDGFNMSSRYFEFIGPDELLVNHEYKGVFKIKIDGNLNQVLNNSKEKSVDKGLNSSLVKFNSTIYYSDKSGIYKFNQSNNTFDKDSVLSSIYNKENFITGKLVADNKTNKLWCFTKNSIDYITPGKISDTPEITQITIPNSLRRGVAGYENITYLNDRKYILGTSNGYFILDLDKLSKRSFDININSISYSEINKASIPLKLNSKSELKNKQNNLQFQYSVTSFDKFFDAQYQYQLKGLYDNWSNWSSNYSVLFENLPYGDYTFNARARLGSRTSDNIASYQFNIEKPWFLSNMMVAIYALMLLVFSVLIHSFYNRYYKRQREKLLEKTQKELELKELENKQQFMQFKNEKLVQDIKNKNRELAISTMSLIKKNEFLNDLKKQLKDADSNKNVRSVIKLINNNINNTDDWKFFEEAFNNADKDFLKRIKSLHPDLTPNDLRLCAYLRLNLSSKEIAPLLNISPKSVEVKRYRLRKKMDLPHETSLTNHILEI